MLVHCYSDLLSFPKQQQNNTSNSVEIFLDKLYYLMVTKNERECVYES